MTHTYASLSSEANRHGERNDCTVRALAVTTGLPYDVCHAALKKRGRKKGRGAYFHQWNGAAADLGFKLVPCSNEVMSRPRQQLVTVARRLPRGRRFLLHVRGHVAGFNGVEVVDWAAGRRHHVRAVYEVVPVLATPKINVRVEDPKISLHTVVVDRVAAKKLLEVGRVLTPPPRVHREKWARQFFAEGGLKRGETGVIELVGDAAVAERKKTGRRGRVFMVFSW